jgi:hypothetical protein
MRSGHSFPPLRAGLIMYLTRNLTPEASGALQLDQSETMHCHVLSLIGPTGVHLMLLVSDSVLDT